MSASPVEIKTTAPVGENEGYPGVEVLDALEAARRYNAMVLRLIEHHAGDARRLLDFGAGLGTFAKLLRTRNRTVTCVEQDRSLLRRLQSDGFETHCELASVPDSSFDFAISLNVLEHLPNDGRILAQLAAKVIPGGTIFVYVPAFAWLWTSLDDRVGHMRRYTRRSLEETAQARDLEVVASGYADSFGVLAALLFKCFGNKRGRLTPASVGAYDRFVVPASMLLDRVAHPFFGKNVWVACRRS